MSDTAEEQRAPIPRSAKWFGLAALSVAGAAFLFLALGGLGDNLVYYWGPTEILAAGPKAVGATIRLGGLVAEKSIVMAPGATSVDFKVTDGKETVPVHSNGVPPQMFREGIGVVVEGTMNAGGTFESSRLMVSHGNEYRAPKPGEKIDTRALIESVQASAGEQK